MGTSSSFGGQGGDTPLIPSWLGGGGEGDLPSNGGDEGNPDPGPAPAEPPAPPLPPIPPAAPPNRFSAARNNLSRFASSGGQDRASLGRAVSHYVSKASGGSRAAAMRMGASREAGSRILGFLSNTVDRGAREALRVLDLENLAGLPIEQVFIGLADYICPDSGTVDDGIARDAFIETIADLAGEGVTDLDSLTSEQMQTVFEIYATNSIEGRLCNDIGGKLITLPSDIREAEQVQVQLHDFIRRGVADALSSANTDAQAMTPDRVLGFVGNIYEQAFEILLIMGDAEAE